MAYSDFTLQEAVKRFQLTLNETADLFVPTPEVAPSPLLTAVLAEQIPLALAIQTEKARSELIIAPILVEVRRAVDHRISLFSGVEFTVDPARGLNGVCDYLLARSHEQLFLQAPVVAIVEAKNENIKAGIGQCTATLVAAQRFNEREDYPLPAVYGAVTTGNIWRFLKLEGQTLLVDRVEYYVDRVEAILGILIQVSTGVSRS